MGDWKNDRAEGEMRKSGEEIMQNARMESEEKENKLWDEIKQSLYVGSSDEDDMINWTINQLRKKGYKLQLPTTDGEN